MEKLEEIFKNKEELKLAENILKVIKESIFTRKDVGIPAAALMSGLHSLGIFKELPERYSASIFIWQFVNRLIEEDYLMVHANTHPRNMRIGLSSSYSKHLNYQYIE